jgi:L-alanine-DL-glutamate epimerase and related enzymes of enolase superfamily
MAKIVGYGIYKLDIPLKRPFITSIRSSKNLKGILCKVVFEEGQVGWGEAAENIKLTGESREEMYRFAKDFFDEHLNEEAEDVLLSLQRFTNHVAPRYGMETAILDAAAKFNQTEINAELGIDVNTRRLNNDTTISILNTQQTIVETKQALSAGYKFLKYKVDANDVEMERILQLEQLIPSDVHIRIDPNQSWTYEKTLRAIQKLAGSSLQVDFIEQPVQTIMYDEMHQLSLKSVIPIVADESVFSLEDAKRVIDNGYGTAINIKLIKCGGPLEAVEIAKFAQRHGVDCLFGCTTESNIALTMAAYLSAGLPSVKAIDLDGLDYIVDSPFVGGINDDNGQIEIPEQNLGLGIDLQESKAEQYVKAF